MICCVISSVCSVRDFGKWLWIKKADFYLKSHQLHHEALCPSCILLLFIVCILNTSWNSNIHTLWTSRKGILVPCFPFLPLFFYCTGMLCGYGKHLISGTRINSARKAGDGRTPQHTCWIPALVCPNGQFQHREPRKDPVLPSSSDTCAVQTAGHCQALRQTQLPSSTCKAAEVECWKQAPPFICLAPSAIWWHLHLHPSLSVMKI